MCFTLIRPSFQTGRLCQTKSVRRVEAQVKQLLLTNVCFGRQVEDHVDVFCVEDVIDQPRVAHISLLEEGNLNNCRLNIRQYSHRLDDLIPLTVWRL